MTVLDRQAALLGTLAAELGVEPRALRAILRAECPGEGLIDGRPLVRLEVHHLWENVATTLRPAVDRLFRVGGPRPQDGHEFRRSPDGFWIPMHQAGRSGQALEWDALEIAAGIDRQVACESTSWGAGQVMGSAWRELGFASLYAFTDLQRDDAGQLRTFARFLQLHHLEAPLAAHDWPTVARVYNGTGQVVYYTGRLQAGYDAG